MARFATSPTLFAADPTLLAPLAAVSLTVSPTDPTVLWPFFDELRPLCDRVVDRDRELAPFDEDDRPRAEEERALDEPREPDRLREFEVFRAFDAFVLLEPLEPFRELLLEPLFREPLLDLLDELWRRLVPAFACAIFVLPPFESLQPRRPYRAFTAYPSKRGGNGR